MLKVRKVDTLQLLRGQRDVAQLQVGDVRQHLELLDGGESQILQGERLQIREREQTGQLADGRNVVQGQVADSGVFLKQVVEILIKMDIVNRQLFGRDCRYRAGYGEKVQIVHGRFVIQEAE